MNWDQLRFQPNKVKQEVDAILEKFSAMKCHQADHSNFLVVIPRMDIGLSSNNKAKALRRLCGNRFSLFYYDERRNIPIAGPVNNLNIYTVIRPRVNPHSHRRRRFVERLTLLLGVLHTLVPSLPSSVRLLSPSSYPAFLEPLL